jgi:hypothetical protein
MFYAQEKDFFTNLDIALEFCEQKMIESGIQHLRVIQQQQHHHHHSHLPVIPIIPVIPEPKASVSLIVCSNNLLVNQILVHQQIKTCGIIK